MILVWDYRQTENRKTLHIKRRLHTLPSAAKCFSSSLSVIRGDNPVTYKLLPGFSASLDWLSNHHKKTHESKLGVYLRIMMRTKSTKYTVQKQLKKPHYLERLLDLDLDRDLDKDLLYRLTGEEGGEYLQIKINSYKKRCFTLKNVQIKRQN